MRPTTIRRLLVFGVCLAGVGCLYLLPSVAGAPGRAGSTSARSDVPTTSGRATALVTALSAEPTSTTGPTSVGGDTARTPSRAGGGDAAGNRGDDQPGSAGRRSAATAIEPGRDTGRPPEVGRLTVVSADPQRLVISWPEVDDDDLVGYEVWLNGFFVVTVQQERARLAWFNDSDTHVIQVRALDAAGHEGPASPTLLVRRPTPTPEPTPSPTSSSTANPTTVPSTAPTADENAGAAPETTIATSSPTAAEAGETKEDRP